MLIDVCPDEAVQSMVTVVVIVHDGNQLALAAGGAGAGEELETG